MTERQLATLQSFPDQILPLCAKIGGRYASWTEADLHRIAFEKHITLQLRARFEDYAGPEPFRAIAFFIKVKASLQKKWNTQWQAERDARQTAILENESIEATCLTWEQVLDWMQEHDRFYKPVERFAFAGKIRGVTYWRKRDALERRLTMIEAKSEWENYGLKQSGRAFEDCFSPVVEPGDTRTLFKRLFTIGGAQ